jgi:tryptophan halogenase
VAAVTLLGGLDGAALSDPRMLKFTAGRRRAFWNRNVVALGLAAGFMEPLESTSIHLVQSAIERVLKFLPNRPIRAADVAAYNDQTAFEWERVRDFLILHYHVNGRTEPFWRDCAAMAVPDSLAEKIDLFRANGRIHRFNEELFAEVGWLQVMVGQGIMPAGYHPLADAPSAAELREFLGLIRQTVAKHVGGMPGHEAFLRQHSWAAGAV